MCLWPLLVLTLYLHLQVGLFYFSSSINTYKWPFLFLIFQWHVRVDLSVSHLSVTRAYRPILLSSSIYTCTSTYLIIFFYCVSYLSLTRTCGHILFLSYSHTCTWTYLILVLHWHGLVVLLTRHVGLSYSLPLLTSARCPIYFSSSSICTCEWPFLFLPNCFQNRFLRCILCTKILCFAQVVF